MNWLLWLAWRQLWRWRGRSCLVVLGLALSVGLLVATGSTGALLQASVPLPPSLLGSPADLWISSAYDVDYDLPADLAAQVEAVDGVAGVQPLLRRPVRVQTPPSLAIDSKIELLESGWPSPSAPSPTPLSGAGGSDPASPVGAGPRPDTLSLLGVAPASYFEFHDLELAAGSLPSAASPGLVALAPWAFVRDLQLGEMVTVTTPSGDIPLPVVGLLEVESLAAAQQGLVLYAPLDTVAELFDSDDTATTLEVRLDPGARRRRVEADLEQALGPAYAVSSVAQPGLGAQLWQRLVVAALLFVDGLTLAGSGALVYAVFSAAARARRRQAGLLRAAGATRRQVLALMMAQATLLGLVGSALGLCLGLVFARVGARLVLHNGGTPTPLSGGSPTGPALPWAWLLVAVAFGLVSSLAGALGPALWASRQPAFAALRPVTAEPLRRTVAGPGWPAWRCLSRAATGMTWLAVARPSRQRGRSVLIVGALALILAMALGNVGVLSLLGEEVATAFGRLAGGDYLVLPGLTAISLRELAGQDTSDLPPLDPGLLSALEDLEDQVWLMGGTSAAIETLQVFPGQPTLLLDVEGYAQMGGFRFQKGDWSRALEAFRQEPAVLLAPVVARRLGVAVGDRVQLATGRGPVGFRVAGIGDSEFTTCILDLDDGRSLLGANEVNAVMVQLRPGTDAEVVRRSLLDAIQTWGGTLLTLKQASAQLGQLFLQARRSMGLLVGVTGLAAMLGVVNAMLTSVAERRREIGLLRCVGATRRQVRRLILIEMAFLGGAAALIGIILGWSITALFLFVARSVVGLSAGALASLGAWLPLLTASLAGLALWPTLAMVAGLIPAVSVARLPALQALYETAHGPPLNPRQTGRLARPEGGV